MPFPAFLDNFTRILILFCLFLNILLLPNPSVAGFACLSNPCVHGICLDDLNSTYFCYCIDGYTGIQCQTNWNECWSSPCQNGGMCIDGIATFNCTCPPGFVGELCEEDVNECDSNPCFNNGTCTDAPNGYSCNCQPGYSGDFCEIDVAVCNATNETRCANGGACIEGPGVSFSCKCPTGWSGMLCDIDINECQSAPCQNGAICVDLLADYACACLFGFTGKNCDEKVKICDHNPCKNGALCLIEEDQEKCYCVPDFHGDLCEFQYDECQLGPRCMNGGTCIDGIDNFTCSCPPNLTGVLCECLILDDSKLDCTYIRPTPYSTTTTISSTTSKSIWQNTTTSTITEETTIVPNFTTILDLSTSTISTIIFMNDTTLFPVTYLTSTPTIIPTTTLTSLTTSSLEIDLNGTETTKISPKTISSTSINSNTENSSTTSEMTTPTMTVSTAGEVKTTEISTTTEYPLIKTTFNFTFDTTTESTAVPSEITTFPVSTSYANITEPSFSSRTSKEMSSSELTTVFSTISTQSITNMITDSIPTHFFTELPGSTEMTSFTIPIIDCFNSKADSCLNGGTCVYVPNRGHKCICPFGTEGTTCEIKLGIYRAAFTGTSYVIHRLVNITDLSFEFDAKTAANDGLLFYATVDATYLVLFIENGYLKFKFSCGYQTMLLSEVKTPVNNGRIMHIKAELHNNGTTCTAQIKLNGTLKMMGNQLKQNQYFEKPTAWLYLGGLPQDFDNYYWVPKQGFIGCIFNLKIFDKPVDIFKDAQDGFEVKECGSLACLSNPCQNGAACISKEDEWECHCKNGYLGKACERSVCDTNPCLFGGTCIQFTSSGYLCLCPFGKHGHFCENDLKISEPYFASSVKGFSSYVAYPIPDAAGVSRNMEIRFRFATTDMEQISLLLFMGQDGMHDFYSDHLAVSFVKGHIMLTWNLGSGPRRIFLNDPIKPGARDYFVRLGHSGRRAWLYVENVGNVTGRSPGNLIQLDVMPLLYLGGYYTQSFSNLPHDLPYHTGFSGCIFDVQMKLGTTVVPLQNNGRILGRAVGQCGTTECHEHSCQNHGACLHHSSTFMCLCQDSWYGPLCSQTLNPCDSAVTKCAQGSTCVPLLSGYECDCPFGRIGKFCDKISNISDVGLTGRRSFIALKPIELNNNKFDIEFELKILNDVGVVLFLGKPESSYLLLSVYNSMLEMKIHTLKIKTNLSIRNTQLLVKGIWHKIRLGVFGRRVYLFVDDIFTLGYLNMGQFLSISKENFIIGGYDDLSQLPTSAISFAPQSLTGCVRQLKINDEPLAIDDLNIEKSRNVVDCDGTPCGKDSCENNGTCWLDSFKVPHCNCLPPYFGDKCEKVPKCDLKGLNCKNGVCQEGTCTCRLGYNGFFCEKEISVKMPEFTGRSYMVVPKTVPKKRDAKNLQIADIYLNFTTIIGDGLLMWSGNDSFYLAIGLENNFFKIVYQNDTEQEKNIKIPTPMISDGLWHNLCITLQPLTIKLDGKFLKIANEQLEMSLLNNSTLFVGGVPTEMRKITRKVFEKNFEGCIEGFGTNGKILKEFNEFDGEGVDICRIV